MLKCWRKADDLSFILFFLVDAADDETMVYAVLRSGPIPGRQLIASDSVCTLHTDCGLYLGHQLQCSVRVVRIIGIKSNKTVINVPAR